MDKPIYFIADLHLSAQSPHLLALFRYFMLEKAPQAQALYILGDLFDFGWEMMNIRSRSMKLNDYCAI